MTEKKKIKTIDIGHSWKAHIRILIMALQHGNEEGKAEAQKELYKIADLLDGRKYDIENKLK